MNKRDKDYFRRLISQKRQKFLEELGSFKSEAVALTLKDFTGDLSAYPYHMADLGTIAAEREMNLQLTSRSSRSLHELDEAKRRIDDGTFGKCDICGKAIAKERLIVVPETTQCIDCKSKEEQIKIQMEGG